MSSTGFDEPSAQKFRSEVREWMSANLPEEWRLYQRQGLSEAGELEIRGRWDRALVAGGYRCLTWPVEYGGRGLGPVEELIFYEEAAKAHAPEELELIGKYLVGPSLLSYGTQAQIEKYVPSIVAALTTWCECLSEPGGGSDLAAVKTFAEKNESGFQVVGRKIWTSFAHYADRGLLLARTSRTDPLHHNLTVFLIDMKQPGVSITPIEQITGLHEFNEVSFEGANVDANDVVGQINDGWKIVTIAGSRRFMNVGQAPRRYVHMANELEQLVQCGIETNRNSENIRQIEDRVELLRRHLRRLVEMIVAGEDTAGPRSVLDLYWTELWQEMTELGVSLFCPVHDFFWRRKYLESRAASIYGGSSELKRNVIAERILSLPRDTLVTR